MKIGGEKKTSNSIPKEAKRRDNDKLERCTKMRTVLQDLNKN